MRLFLSSFRLGNRPEQLRALLGTDRRTALIHNANDSMTADERKESLAQEVERLESIGLEPTEVDFREYFDQPAGLKELLSSFALVWVRGGNVFTLRRALRQSGADEVITELLRADAVAYGGYSAGVCVLSPSLRGLELVDDPNTVPDRYEAPIIWECLSVLPYAVAPHYKSDHPESAKIDGTVAYYIANHVPFVALRDGEAILINEGKELVVG